MPKKLKKTFRVITIEPRLDSGFRGLKTASRMNLKSGP